jgi:hypothetical protein
MRGPPLLGFAHFVAATVARELCARFSVGGFAFAVCRCFRIGRLLGGRIWI